MSENALARGWKGFLRTTTWGDPPRPDDELARHRSTTEERVAHHEKVMQQRIDSASSGSDTENNEVDEKGNALTHVDTAGTTMTTFDQAHEGLLYRNGEMILLPAPTKDPRDPLNLPLKRKALAIFFVSFFGALVAAAELILGSMLPVFAFVYANPSLNPKSLLPLTTIAGGFPAHTDPLSNLQNLPGLPPIWHIYLLASLPILVIGLSNLALIPLAIAIGRRAIILTCGVVAIIGAIWAGFSQSLGSHIGARCIQAIGAGTIESLIPFIIQDMAHYHQRNTYISVAFAAQGIIIISIGIASPYIIINLNWRYVYFITAGAAGFFLLGVFFFLPETRWHRTKAEMNGVPRQETNEALPQRTISYDLALFHGKMEWRKGWMAFLNTLRTFFYPQIFFITMLNSAMIATAVAAAYTVSPALLTKPWSWPFLHLGLCLIPVLIAAIFVGFLTGYMADWVANWAAKKRGRRIPENQLINLVLPTVVALIGSVLFGVAGQDQTKYGWPMFLTGLAFMTFGFLGANTIGAVYVLECYPHLAGPSLVNIASFRCLLAFALSFKVSEWIADFGYLNSYMIYVGIMGFFAALIPVVYIWGPAWRKRWPATKYSE